MSKCENCRLRKESAKAFDIHWLGEDDCPYADCPVPDSNNKKPDIDILIHAALDAGATVRKVKPGDGGFFVNGRKLTDGNLEECILNPKPPTNADRIRSMTDEELASFMNHGACPPGENVAELCADEDNGSVPDLCNLCWLDWLREEHKSED